MVGQPVIEALFDFAGQVFLPVAAVAGGTVLVVSLILILLQVFDAPFDGE